MASRIKRTKVGRACQRCRRQKLRCDIQRPCTLCVHAGVDCQMGGSDQFIISRPSGSRQTRSRRSTREQMSPREDQQEEHHVDQSWSSSTMSLVAGAFQFHNSSTPDTSMTTAFPGGVSISSPPEQRPDRPTTTTMPIPRIHGSWSLFPTEDLAALLPSREVASLLIDTYFDRVHWFILIFHQDDFRQSWQQMYDCLEQGLISRYSKPGFISTFLVVIAIALQYTGPHRQSLLRNHNVIHSDLKEKILSTIRAKLLDIVSLGSLECVQTCVLLGTYYLYHGSPGLAWPVCGCGLRVAQALNLHRKLPINACDISPEVIRQSETRKRCWWAIYEIETFCSMSYGYPHGIKDADCDVELLDPLATSSGQSPATFDATHQCSTSLLSYKYLMSKLSVLVKDMLTDLYGISHQGSIHKDNPNSRGLQNVIRKVSRLDDRLQKWKSEIPSALQPSATATSYSSVEEMDTDIGASGPRFEQHIYQLQALSLELAYENARILLHRPLLAYKMIPRSNHEPSNVDSEPPSPNPLRFSLTACRDAALYTSNLGESPIFLLAADTYAASFIGIHTFTAGVMLCILSSIEPLSPQSHDSKMGLRRLLKMQGHLKSRTQSTLAAQGHEILERLTRLVMEKELKEMLASDKAASQSLLPAQQASTGNNSPVQNLVSNIPEVVQDDGTFDFIQDPAMSQALFDFDQVLSGNDMNIPLDPLFPDIAGPGNGFTQEQAWIWGMDSLLRFPGTE